MNICASRIGFGMLLVVLGTGCGFVVEGGSGNGSTGGATSGGAVDPGGDGTCDIPFDTLYLETPCPEEIPYLFDQTIEGVFEPSPTGGAFVVTSLTGEPAVSIWGVDAAIPAGTLVSLRYGCGRGFNSDKGTFVAIKNVPSIGETINPTEAGTRLWYEAMGRGVVDEGLAPGLVFSWSEVPACERPYTGKDAEQYEHGVEILYDLRVTDPESGASAQASSADTAQFSVPSGTNAGEYLLKNRFVYEDRPLESFWSYNFELSRLPDGG
jgi:hypothetical protein